MIETQETIQLEWISRLAFGVSASLVLAFLLAAFFFARIPIFRRMISKVGAALGAGGLFGVVGYLLPPGEVPQIWLVAGLVSGGFIGALFGFGSGMFLPMGPDSLSFAFARRISFRSSRAVSGLLVVLGIISIALGVGVMEISTSILKGFMREIQNKVVGFGSHIQITDYSGGYEAKFVSTSKHTGFVKPIRELPEVKTINPYIYLPGMLQNKEDLEGVIMKGVDAHYDWGFFKDKLKEGNLPEYNDSTESKDILLSFKLSKLLQVKTGDRIMFYYFEERPRVRKLKIAGLYESGLEEFDATNVLCDIRMLQNLAGFGSDEVMGFEVTLHDLRTLNRMTNKIDEMIPVQLLAIPITEKFPAIFDWLNVQHQNVWAIVFLMMLIAIINMITVSLILIMERTRTIGVLKAIGMGGSSIMRIFSANAFIIILIGVTAGNILGLSLIALQDATGIIQVNQENYFVTTVPVDWPWDLFLMINVGVIILCTVFTLLPMLAINRIRPMDALRYE